MYFHKWQYTTIIAYSFREIINEILYELRILNSIFILKEGFEIDNEYKLYSNKRKKKTTSCNILYLWKLLYISIYCYTIMDKNGIYMMIDVCIKRIFYILYYLWKIIVYKYCCCCILYE